MKVVDTIPVLAVLSASLGSAFAAQTQIPCQSSWSSCAIGRVDFFETTPATTAKFLIDAFYGSSQEISQGVPMLGEGKLGIPSSQSPAIQVYVLAGSNDLMLDVSSPQMQTFTLGKLMQPVGSDETIYYTREVHLNPGVQITESAAQTWMERTCDPSGVFGVTENTEQLSSKTYTISGLTAQPLTYSVQRTKILGSHPSPFGCGK